MGALLKLDAPRRAEPGRVKSEFQSLNLADMKEHFAQMRKHELKATPYATQWVEARNKMFYVYDMLVKNACKVDASRLTGEDRKVFSRVLYEEVPEAVEKAVADGVANWWANKTTSYESHGQDALEASCRKVQELLKKQRNPAYQRAEIATGTDETLLNGLSFPKRSFDSEELAGALNLLEEAWNLARQRSLKAEESYMIQAVANSYLPDMWRAIKGFETFPAVKRQQVEAHVLEQITLLNEQIENLLAANMEASLAAVEAQTHFLRAKREQARTSRLKLWRR